MTANILEEISSIIGIDTALRLCKQFGGVSYYIPQVPKLTHAWMRVLDAQQWAKVCAEYGGTSLTLPQGEHHIKRQRVDALLNEGRLSHRKIAMATGSTERYVQQRWQRIRQAEAQNLPLFDGLGA